MSESGWRVAAIGVLMATWWITEAVPIPVTALLPLLLFPVFGVAPIAGAAAPYANPIIFLFMGGFIIAMALEACGLHRRMALVVIRAMGTRPVNLIAGFMAATAFLGMWVSNTATVVMMLPMALSVVQMMERQGEPASTPDPNFALALLLGLAYAANIGGLGTLIGTPPNALLAGFMSEAYGVQIGFGEWMLVGVPLVLVMLPICWLLLTRVLFRIRSEQIAGGDAVIQAEIRSLGSLSRTELIVGSITALTAGAWIFQPLVARIFTGISDAGIAIAGALLLFLVPVNWRRGEFALRWEQAERLPWAVLVLFGGGLSLANAVQQTGLAEWIGSALSGLRDRRHGQDRHCLRADHAGVGCRLLAFDPEPNPECQDLGVEYVGLVDLFAGSDIIALHCPLNPHTHHLIDAEAVERMRRGVMLINTSRGGLIDTQAVIEGLKSGKIGYMGLDVYEEEADLFFEDLSGEVIRDDVFARLLTFPNVLITGHQGFFTAEALERIATTTLDNITAFQTGVGQKHEVGVEVLA